MWVLFSVYHERTWLSDHISYLLFLWNAKDSVCINSVSCCMLTTESGEYTKDGCTLWGGDHVLLIWLCRIHFVKLAAFCSSMCFLWLVIGWYLNDIQLNDWTCWQSKDAGIKTLVMLDEQGGNVEMWWHKLCICLYVTVDVYWKRPSSVHRCNNVFVNSHWQLVTVIIVCHLHVINAFKIRSYSV